MILLKKHFLYSAGNKGYAHYFYSRYPLEKLDILTGDNQTVGVYKSSVKIGSDIIVLYGCHFANNNYTADRQYITLNSINRRSDFETFTRDIGFAYNQRGREAKILAEDISSDHNILVMGDFNDVCGS